MRISRHARFTLSLRQTLVLAKIHPSLGSVSIVSVAAIGPPSNKLSQFSIRQNRENLIRVSALGEFQFGYKARATVLLSFKTSVKRETRAMARRRAGGHTSITTASLLSLSLSLSGLVGSFESLQNSKSGWQSVKVFEIQLELDCLDKPRANIEMRDLTVF